MRPNKTLTHILLKNNKSNFYLIHESEGDDGRPPLNEILQICSKIKIPENYRGEKSEGRQNKKNRN